MATLHIEHPITDLSAWLGAFARFQQARTDAGVRSEAIHQPVDDDKYIYIRLEFDSIERANAFKQFLETNVWTSREASPGLGGPPRARADRGEPHDTDQLTHGSKRRPEHSPLANRSRPQSGVTPAPRGRMSGRLACVG